MNRTELINTLARRDNITFEEAYESAPTPLMRYWIYDTYYILYCRYL